MRVSLPQCVVGALAGEAGGSAGISLKRQLSRSSVSERKQLGEQKVGGVGCLATSGRGGTRAGATSGSAGTRGIVQADSSSVSSGTVNQHLLGDDLVRMDGLLLSSAPRLFFVPLALAGAGRGGGDFLTQFGQRRGAVIGHQGLRNQ